VYHKCQGVCCDSSGKVYHPFRIVGGYIFSLLPLSGSVGLGPESFSIAAIALPKLLVNDVDVLYLYRSLDPCGPRNPSQALFPPHFLFRTAEARGPPSQTAFHGE